MGKVTAFSELEITAPIEKVRALIGDYLGARSQILTEHFHDYQVIEGGSGAGTKVSWKLQATAKRVRNVVADITEPQPGTVVETDENSSMVTTWSVREAVSTAAVVVRIETTWNGAGGIGGFFEKTFAPKGLKRIYDEMLGKLAALV